MKGEFNICDECKIRIAPNKCAFCEKDVCSNCQSLVYLRFGGSDFRDSQAKYSGTLLSFVACKRCRNLVIKDLRDRSSTLKLKNFRDKLSTMFVDAIKKDLMLNELEEKR